MKPESPEVRTMNIALIIFLMHNLSSQIKKKTQEHTSSLSLFFLSLLVMPNDTYC